METTMYFICIIQRLNTPHYYFQYKLLFMNIIENIYYYENKCICAITLKEVVIIICNITDSEQCGSGCVLAP